MTNDFNTAKSKIPVLTDIVKPASKLTDNTQMTPKIDASKTRTELERLIESAIHDKLQFYLDSISSDIAAEIMVEIKRHLEKNNP